MEVAALVRQVRQSRSLPPPALRREIRRAAGLSLEQVASAVGVSRQAVAHWEAGTRRPRASHLALYLDLLEQLREAVG